jgi:hypothetical protein
MNISRKLPNVYGWLQLAPHATIWQSTTPMHPYSSHTRAVLLQELQVQEGGDVSFLAADYQALLGDAQPQASSTGSDQQAAATSADSAGPEKDAGLDAAVGSIMCLFQDCVRFSTGATGAVQRQLPGLEKLLQSEAGGVCSLQAAVEYMSRAL